MEKTEETGNVGWTVQCRHSISKAVQESAHLYNEWQTHLVGTGSPPLTRFSNNRAGFLNDTIYFGTLICPFSTKSLLRLHGCLLTQLFFLSLKKQRKQRIPCKFLLSKTLPFVGF